MISAKIFLKVLAKKDLLPSDAIRKLRRQIEESPQPIPAEVVAKRLVKKGYLTSQLAKRLLKTAAAAEKKLNEQASETIVDTPVTPHESNLGFATSDEEKSEEDNATAESWELDLDDAPAAEPPKTSKKEKPAAKVDAEPAASDDEEVFEGEVVIDDPVVGDMPMDVDAAEASLDQAAAAGATEQKSRKAHKHKKGIAGVIDTMEAKKDRKRKDNPWDTKLILVGGGMLLAFVIAGVTLIWLLFGQSGDQMYEQAKELYQQGAYTKAIGEYDRFIEKYPGHDSVSIAKVKRGLAQLRQAVEVVKNNEKSLEVAVQVLEKIRSENAFPEAKPELKVLLETIAEGLSDQARRETDPKRVAQTEEAVKLIGIYVQKSKRNKVLMENIEASLEITRREIARDDELAKAIAAMDEMIAQGEPGKAYNVRRMLLKTYPDLLENEQLQAAILKVSAAQQSAVRFVDQAKAAEVPTPADENRPAVSIAQRDHRKNVSGANGGVVCAMAEGAMYGLDAADGKVLWRRFVGYTDDGSSLQHPPVPVSPSRGSDVLVVDAQKQSLVRVQATTGNVRWRQVIGEAFRAQPVLDRNNRALIATSTGQLVYVDLGSGNSPGYIKVPQPLTTAPAIDLKSGRIFQVADHSNLYVLTPEGKCEAVIHLAHAPNTITASPVIISRLLVVAENRSHRNALLRVFSLEANGETPAFSELQQIEIEGHVDMAPLVSGARMLTTTDIGRVVAFRVSGSNDQQPIERVAPLQTSDEANLVRFPLLVRDQFFVADKKLTKYELLASMGSFRTKWTAFSNSVFLQPLTSIGRSVFFVRRRIGLPGVQVAAVAMDKHNILWETNLAVPLAGEPVVMPSGDVEVVTELGSLMKVSADQLRGQVTIDQAVVALRSDEVRHAVNAVLRISDGLVVLSTGFGSDQLAVFNPNRLPKQFRPAVLQNPLGADPAPMASGLLVPCQLGQAFLVDPKSGSDLAEPFQVKLVAGQQVAWQSPVAVGPDSVVIADGRDRIYRLVVQDQPVRHVAAAAEATLTSPIASRLAVLGDLVYAADKNEQLLRLRLPNLSPSESLPLGGRVSWGPKTVGEHVFLTTENDQLFCLNNKGEVAWKVILVHGPLAGQPLPSGGNFLLAYRNGLVSLVDGTSGNELAKIETGRPLNAGPVSYGENLLLTGCDGTLYLSEKPSQSE